jgi:muramoyltetrapeptide carboxypeptidase
VLIEEVHERAYRIDRALAHLSQAGVFDQAKALLLGDFIDRGEPDGRFLVQETLNEFATQCSLPVLQISNVGHGASNNPLLLGSTAKLTTGSCYSLDFF